MNVLSTVYDESRMRHHERNALLILIHIYSWKKYVSDEFPLDVVCVGEPKKRIGDAIEDAGATIKVVGNSHPLARLRGTYNKHIARPREPTKKRVFLSDNDTVYLGSAKELFTEDPQKVLVSLAPRARINQATWDLIINVFGAKPVELEWMPRELMINDFDTAQKDGCVEKYAYFNSGAVVFPQDARFWDLWETRSFELARFLEQRGINGREAVGTDQGSLALALADYGNWGYLPEGFNHMYVDYARGDIDAQDVRHIHMPGTGRYFKNLDPNERVSAKVLIKSYWDEHIIRKMRECSRNEREIDVAVNHRDSVLKIIEDNGLEDLRQFSRKGAHPRVGNKTRYL